MIVQYENRLLVNFRKSDVFQSANPEQVWDYLDCQLYLPLPNVIFGASVPYLQLLFLARLQRFQLPTKRRFSLRTMSTVPAVWVVFTELSWNSWLNLWANVEMWALRGSKFDLIRSSIRSGEIPVTVSMNLSALLALDASIAFSVNFLDVNFDWKFNHL